MDPDTILQTRGLTKRYPGALALDAVDFALAAGEVHGLVGQNGAGKSTFVEIVAGTLGADEGRIIVGGAESRRLSPSEAIRLGIQTVHQDNLLVEDLTVAENVLLHDLPVSGPGIYRHSACTAAAQSVLKELGIDVRPEALVRSLSFIEKKLVSIAKAFSRNVRVLILDEPTASLDGKGIAVLFGLIRRCAATGCGVIYISHNLAEIFEICDRVTVFRDGRKTATRRVADFDIKELIRAMIGRQDTAIYVRQRPAPRAGAARLEAIGYGRAGFTERVSFSVGPGEIFGLAGLVGSGRTELARLLFGLEQRDSGRLLLDGVDITPRRPSEAIRSGIGFLTEDRKVTGLLLERPIFENISLVRLAKAGDALLRLGRERKETGAIATRLTVKAPSTAVHVSALSGGNQQKVVLAKWLFAGSGLLIIDEPTVGIDVGAKGEIYRLMDELAAGGAAIIMISSYNPELVAVCDRIGIMRDGRLAAILQGEKITEEAIVRHSIGIGTGDRSQ